MPEQPDPIRERFIYEIGEFAGGLGLSRSVGQLYAFLYMSPDPACLDDMAEACGMSKATASINIRELERWGAVRKVWVRGDRKDYYEANRDVPGIALDRLRDGLGRRLNGLENALEQAAQQIEQMTDDPASRDFYRKRLKELGKYRGAMERVLKNMDRIYAVARRFM